MKTVSLPQDASLVTLQTVLDRLTANTELAARRKRDLRSGIACFAKLVDQPPSAIALDLAAIRQTLDTIVPAWAKVSRKRWANLRSDLAAAIDASGLRPMLKTTGVELNAAWRPLLDEAPPWTRHGLSRLARWSSLRGIPPAGIDDSVIERFVAELHSSTLVRKISVTAPILCVARGTLLSRSIPRNSGRLPSGPTCGF
jgi:hypothetical protein